MITPGVLVLPVDRKTIWHFVVKPNRTITKVTEDLEGFSFNTAVASLMELVNTMYQAITTLCQMASVPRSWMRLLKSWVVLLSPFAPHIADELWQLLGKNGFLYRHPWPTADATVAITSEVTMVIQVNGKVRDHITVSADTDPGISEKNCACKSENPASSGRTEATESHFSAGKTGKHGGLVYIPMNAGT